MAAPPLATVDKWGILAVRARDCAAKTIDSRRFKDEMHMIWHQAIGSVSYLAAGRQQRPVERIVAIVEERCLTS